MTKTVKNRIVTVLALLLLAVAVFLVIQLIMGDEGLLLGGDKAEITTQETVTTVPPSRYDHAAADVDSKYLWEYGWQEVEKEKPSEVPEETTTKAKDEVNYDGLLIYNDEQQTTQQTTLPQADGVYEIATGANGEVLTDSAGEFVTKPAEPTTEAVTGETTASDSEVNTTASSSRTRSGIFDFSVF